MDPVTQTLAGAIAAQTAMTGRLGRRAALIGGVAGELPDVDVFFGPWTDPALPFELHRHFTHALAFIPFGAAIVAAPFLLLRSFRKQAGAVYVAALVAYATHGLIDNCTSYGTHLYWPFLEHRTAWDAMSIIDPLFTGALFLGALLAFILRRAAPARVALVIGLAYIAMAFGQHERAERVQGALAAERGHVIDRGRVMPTLGNVIVWRSVYEADGTLYADAIRALPFGAATIREGAAVRRFTVSDLPPGVPEPERVRDVFERFSAFADGFTATAAGDAGPGFVVGDMRYSMDAATFDPIWGVRIVPEDRSGPIRFEGFRGGREGALGDLWREVRGIHPGYR